MKAGRFLAVLLVTACSYSATAADAPRLQPGRPMGQGKPNFNGIWQALNTANWNLEAHSAQKIDSAWAFGALFSIPAGKSVVVGGRIPYLPEALQTRDQSRAEWPKSD